MIQIRKTLGWLLFLFLYFGIRLPLMIVGILFFPVMYYTRDKKTDNLKKIFWLWDNEEDGIYGAQFWLDKYKGVKNLKTAYTWSAIRNPVNNMRFVFGINRDEWEKDYLYYGDKEIPTPKFSRLLGRPIWHLSYIKAWGIYLPSFWYINPTGDYTHFRVRLGWKSTWKWIENNELSETGKWSGFAIQFLPKRKG